MTKSVLYYFHINPGFAHSCCEGMAKGMSAEMRRQHLWVIAFQKLIIIAVSYNPFIADALVLGPLRTEAVVLPVETLQKIKAYGVDAKTERLMITLAEYYTANKEPDCEWAIIPRINISAHLDSATYVEAYENKMPEGFIEKKPEMGGVTAVRITI